MAVGYLVDRGLQGQDAYGYGILLIGALGLLIGGLTGGIIGAVIATRARLSAPAAGDVLGAAIALLVVRPSRRVRRQSRKKQLAQVIAASVGLSVAGFIASQSVLVGSDRDILIITRDEVVVRVQRGDRVAIKLPFVEQAHRFRRHIVVQLKDYQVVTSKYAVNADEVDVYIRFDKGDSYFDVARDGESLVKPALDAALNALDYPSFVSYAQERATFLVGARFDAATLEQPYDVSIYADFRLGDIFVDTVIDPLKEELHESLGVDLISMRFWGATVTPR